VLGNRVLSATSEDQAFNEATKFEMNKQKALNVNTSQKYVLYISPGFKPIVMPLQLSEIYFSLDD